MGLMPGSNISLQDAQAFSRLYEEANLLIFRYIYGIYGGPSQDVEDITAETFARAWKARTQFSGDQNDAVSWLIQIARNLVIDNYRREKGRDFVTMDQNQLTEFLVADNVAGPENYIEHKQQIATLWKVVQSLPIEQKELIVLRYILGWRVNRIAEHTGLLENTVSVRIRRILHQIRDDWPD